MKHNVMLTIASLLSILLMTLHLTSDTVHAKVGTGEAGGSTLVAVPGAPLIRGFRMSGKAWCPQVRVLLLDANLGSLQRTSATGVMCRRLKPAQDS